MTVTVESEASSLHIFDDLIQGEPRMVASTLRHPNRISHRAVHHPRIPRRAGR